MTNTRYDEVVIEIFRRHDGASKDEFEFERSELSEIYAARFDEPLGNPGDVPYTYRSGRRELPSEIASTGNWIIEPRGKGRYAFKQVSRSPYVVCPPHLKRIGILDATPDIVLKYGGRDEQGLLTKIRYNRLIDIFLSLTAYHLQGHVRAYVSNSGQVEIDDLYLGVDTDGTQYVIPVEAKTADETLGIVQVVSLNAFAWENYPELTLRSVAVKSCSDGSIFFMEFNNSLDHEDIEVVQYKRYQLIRDEALAKQLGLDLESIND